MATAWDTLGWLLAQRPEIVMEKQLLRSRFMTAAGSAVVGVILLIAGEGFIGSVLLALGIVLGAIALRMRSGR